MKHIYIVLGVLIFFIFLSAKSNGGELTFEFGSPSFSGKGQSSHYLTIENIEKTRQDAIDAQIKADAEKAKTRTQPRILPA